MANILEYLDWRGDLTLSERPFNEVDNLILAEICYLDFSGFVPAGFQTQQVTPLTRPAPILPHTRKPTWVFSCPIRSPFW